MKNKIPFQLIFMLLILITSFYLTSCENGAQTNFTGNLRGYVYDSLGRLPISLVKVTNLDVNVSGFTSDSGLFVFNNISMPRSEVNFNFTFEKTGYKTAVYLITFKSDMTTTVDSLFMVRDTL